MGEYSIGHWGPSRPSIGGASSYCNIQIYWPSIGGASLYCNLTFSIQILISRPVVAWVTLWNEMASRPGHFWKIKLKSVQTNLDATWRFTMSCLIHYPIACQLEGHKISRIFVHDELRNKHLQQYSIGGRILVSALIPPCPWHYWQLQDLLPIVQSIFHYQWNTCNQWNIST